VQHDDVKLACEYSGLEPGSKPLKYPFVVVPHVDVSVLKVLKAVAQVKHVIQWVEHRVIHCRQRHRISELFQAAHYIADATGIYLALPLRDDPIDNNIPRNTQSRFHTHPTSMAPTS
jgi:hypothetical protein